jgi:ribosomal protein S18 acetylase RimI-like enzyme
MQAETNDMIQYITTFDGVSADHLRGGFFVGWPNPPTPETHLRLLRQSAKVVLAIEENGAVVGFITAISDGVLSAYIPLLEVLPEYQDRGIGSELVRRMLDMLADVYMVDLLCDPELQPYYERLGMRRAVGMLRRNYDRQAGSTTE